jgi:hypothetical protein
MTPGWEVFFGTEQTPDLGPGPRPGVQPQSALEGELAKFFGRHPTVEPQRTLLKALVLLWHDHLDAAHTLAQEVENADGALVHGIMHRREPDYSNAAYWFRRVGRHPAFPWLARGAMPLLQAQGGERYQTQLLPEGRWDPFAFIEACEEAAAKPPGDADRELLRKLQSLESQVLFEHFTKDLPT